MRIKRKMAVGLLGFMLFTSPFFQGNPITEFTSITALAAESYSDNWQMDSTGTWHYMMEDGTLAKDAWVHDCGYWYLLDENGNMLTGLVKSNGGKYYLLDTIRGTGTYGKMLQNGGVYEGITISASTNADDEGSLSEGTLSQLVAANKVDLAIAPNVENTKHIENGAVVYANEPVSESNSSESSQSWKDEEEAALDKYFGGRDGEISSSGDNPLSGGGTTSGTQANSNSYVDDWFSDMDPNTQGGQSSGSERWGWT